MAEQEKQEGATMEGAQAPVAPGGPEEKQQQQQAAPESVVIVDPKDIQFPRVCPGHSRPVVSVNYSAKTQDGVFLVTGCHDKLPMLRWGDNGDWIGSFPEHKGAVWAASFNSDATKVATGSGDFSARLFDAVTGELIHTWSHKHIVKAVEFSRNDDKLLAGGNEKAIVVYDLKAVDYCVLATLPCKGPVRKASWVPAGDKGEMIICGCDTGDIQVFDYSQSSGAVREWKVEDPVKDLEVCVPQNKIVVAAGKSVYFYDMKTYDLLKKIDIGLQVEGCSLNPVTGKHFIIGGKTDLWVHVFDYDSGHEIRNHTGHHGPVFCMRYAPDGLTYASGSEDGTLRLWRLEDA